MSTWHIVGQVGNIVKKKNTWLITIAENKYDKETCKKLYTIWYICICKFEPNILIGNTVIANGHFEPSKNKDFPFAMIVDHIGTINKNQKDDKFVDFYSCNNFDVDRTINQS